MHICLNTFMYAYIQCLNICLSHKKVDKPINKQLKDLSTQIHEFLWSLYMKILCRKGRSR